MIQYAGFAVFITVSTLKVFPNIHPLCAQHLPVSAMKGSERNWATERNIRIV